MIDIRKVEEKYDVKYIGYYDIPGRDNVYVFYQANPKTELGHSNYLGVFVHYKGNILDSIAPEIYLTNAKSILDAKYPAIQLEDGTVLCSRYRHDYQGHESGAFIDGGLDYTRCNPNFRPNGHIQIIEDKEVFVAN